MISIDLARSCRDSAKSSRQDLDISSNNLPNFGISDISSKFQPVRSSPTPIKNWSPLVEIRLAQIYCTSWSAEGPVLRDPKSELGTNQTWTKLWTALLQPPPITSHLCWKLKLSPITNFSAKSLCIVGPHKRFFFHFFFCDPSKASMAPTLRY